MIFGVHLKTCVTTFSDSILPRSYQLSISSCFETGSHFVAILTLNSQICPWLCLWRAVIKGVGQHAKPEALLQIWSKIRAWLICSSSFFTSPLLTREILSLNGVLLDAIKQHVLSMILLGLRHCKIWNIYTSEKFFFARYFIFPRIRVI